MVVHPSAVCLRPTGVDVNLFNEGSTPVMDGLLQGKTSLA